MLMMGSKIEWRNWDDTMQKKTAAKMKNDEGIHTYIDWKKILQEEGIHTYQEA